MANNTIRSGAVARATNAYQAQIISILGNAFTVAEMGAFALVLTGGIVGGVITASRDHDEKLFGDVTDKQRDEMRTVTQMLLTDLKYEFPELFTPEAIAALDVPPDGK